MPTKKSVIKKPKGIVAEPIVEEVVEVKEPEVKKKKFASDDGILCTSITTGWLGMEGLKSHTVYQWHSYGDQTEVEYDDLVAAVRSTKSYVFAPYFVIDDEDFLELYPQVKNIYENLPRVEELEKVLDLAPDKMREVISALPKGAKESVKSMAASRIKDGTFDSVNRIRILDEVLGTELSLLASV